LYGCRSVNLLIDVCIDKHSKRKQKMEKLVLAVHIITALAIIGLILLQQGKGAAAGASFGSGASQTVFGSEGSGSFFTRATAVFATIFFCTSFGLAIIAKNSSLTVDGMPIPVPAQMQQQSDVPVVDGAAGAANSDVPAVPESE
jgi:preprotein translocase subunit SecG